MKRVILILVAVLLLKNVEAQFDIKIMKLLKSNCITIVNHCNDSIEDVKVLIENVGNQNVNSYKIKFGYLENNNQVIIFEQQRNCNLQPNQIDTVDLSIFSPFKDVVASFFILATDPNNGVDVNTMDNWSHFLIYRNVFSTPLPYTLTFNNDMEIGNYLNFYSSDYTCFFQDVMEGVDDNYSFKLEGMIKGGKDGIILPLLNFQNPINPKLTFFMKHDYLPTYVKDTFRVEVSSDCGNTWTTVWQKVGQQLPTTQLWLSWRFESVDLSSYQGLNEVLIKFESIADEIEHYKSLSIDMINIQNTPTGNKEETLKNELKLYPTIIESDIYISNGENSVIEIYDVIGKLLYSKQITSSLESINVSFLNEGSYLIKIINNDDIIVKKVIKR